MSTFWLFDSKIDHDIFNTSDMLIPIEDVSDFIVKHIYNVATTRLEVKMCSAILNISSNGGSTARARANDQSVCGW